MADRSLYQLGKIIQEWLWKHGGEDYDWGQTFEKHPGQNSWNVPVNEFIRAAVAKDLATRLKDQRSIENANQSIQALMDEYCGTPGRKWPWPGPPPGVWDIVTQLALVANTLQPGGLRTEIEGIAGKIAASSNVL
jgi:hypothetical protein